MDRILDFEYYEKDVLGSRVHVNYTKGTITVENFVDDPVEQVFGRQEVNFDTLLDFFEDRVFPETRVNCQELLELMGLKNFDALDIAKITHGIMVEDFNWIRFNNEDFTYKDVAKLRKEYFGREW